MLVGILFLAAFCALSPRDHRGDAQVRERPTVERICADWRAGRITTPVQLSSELAKLGRDAAPALCTLLDAAAADIPRPAIARALGSVGSRHSVPSLARFAASPSVENRIAGAEALGLLGIDETLPILATSLDDEEPAVVEAVESAILVSKAVPEHVADALSHRLVKAKEKSRVALLLARLGTEEGHQALLDHVGAIDEAECLAALQGLWMVAKPEDGEAVVHLLTSSSPDGVRKQTCLLLGRLKYRPSIRGLVDCLRDADTGVRSNAHWALGQITGLPLEDDPELWESWLRRSGDTGVTRRVTPAPSPARSPSTGQAGKTRGRLP